MAPHEDRNPFSVQTPEDIEASEALRLFVDVFTDFNKIREIGHSMINGARGCGKSMMFRYLQPDCQRLVRNCELQDLPFFAVLISIKNTDLNLTELQRLRHRPANVILNEHFLTMYVASRAFLALSKVEVQETADHLSATLRFYHSFLRRLVRNGWPVAQTSQEEPKTIKDIFLRLGSLCDDFYGDVIQYVRQLSVATESPQTKPYTGPLCGYIEFLYPVFQDLREMPYMPKGQFSF